MAFERQQRSAQNCFIQFIPSIESIAALTCACKQQHRMRTPQVNAQRIRNIAAALHVLPKVRNEASFWSACTFVTATSIADKCLLESNSGPNSVFVLHTNIEASKQSQDPIVCLYCISMLKPRTCLQFPLLLSLLQSSIAQHSVTTLLSHLLTQLQ